MTVAGGDRNLLLCDPISRARRAQTLPRVGLIMVVIFRAGVMASTAVQMTGARPIVYYIFGLAVVYC